MFFARYITTKLRKNWQTTCVKKLFSVIVNWQNKGSWIFSSMHQPSYFSVNVFVSTFRIRNPVVLHPIFDTTNNLPCQSHGDNDDADDEKTAQEKTAKWVPVHASFDDVWTVQLPCDCLFASFLCVHWSSLVTFVTFEEIHQNRWSRTWLEINVLIN